MYSSILYADEKWELCAAMNQWYIILEKLVEKIINWIFNYQDSALRNKSVYHLMWLLEKEGIKCFDVMEAYKPYTAGTAKKYEELQKMLWKNKPSEDTYVDLSGI